MWKSTGINTTSGKNYIMIVVGLILLYLGIGRGYEPLLMIPIAVGAILVNVPGAEMMMPGGFLYYLYHVGIATGVFPLLIFMGVGAHTDFGPLIANPRMALLGAAAQFGIFSTLLGALALKYIPGFPIEFTLKEAAAIGIIGGADGPTAIYLTSKLADHLLGPIAIAAYSYMALVPIIQPPIMRALCSKEEMSVEMKQLRHVTKMEKIIFPLMVILMCALFIPSAVPLVGMLMFGNLIKECGAVERLNKAAQNEILNVTTIFLALAVGSKMQAEYFLTVQSIGIIVLGLIAFSIGTASGVLLGKVMYRLSGKTINPLIGAAGVSAVPMAARVVQKVGVEVNPKNFLLMHAMGPNVSGVIGSAIAAGVLLSLLG
ncbi:MAG: sodium ion-translocating decarboxylase subunit beta [Nitrospinota bacterium]|nr:sodium ion-translocating decarboxylase subunit beta [Nitrospinota bacterium]